MAMQTTLGQHVALGGRSVSVRAASRLPLIGPCRTFPVSESPADSGLPHGQQQHINLPLALGAVLVSAHAAAHPASAAEEPQQEDAALGDDKRKERRPKLKPRELGKLLHMSDEAAMLLIERVPELLRHPVHRLQASVQRLEQVLKLDERAVCALAVKQPRILLIPADQVPTRLQDLALLLKVKEEEARSLSQQQPGLLTHQSEVLQARLAALVSLIKEAVGQQNPTLPGQTQGPAVPTSGTDNSSRSAPPIAHPAVTAALMCRREPGLLTLTHAQLTNKLTALATALGSPQSLVPAIQLASQAPTVVLLPPTRTATIVSTLCSLLSLPTRAAADLLIRVPRLLTTTPDRLTGSLRALSLALGVERETAAVMCAAHPALLLVSATDVPARLKALAKSLEVPEEKAVQLVKARPQLLLKDPAAVDAALKAARKRGEL